MASIERFPSAKGGVLLPVFVLAAVLLAFEVSDVDLWLQDLLYSFDRHQWLIAKSDPLPRALFYHAPKVLLILSGVWLLFSLITPFHWQARRWLSTRPKRELLYVLLCLSLFPICINALKKISGIHCPSELSRYEGQHEYRKVFSAHSSDPKGHGRCFPAGHASGGFALLGLWFVARNKREKALALAAGLGAGWMMGTYQILNGAHFLSHTVVTMLLAWIFTVSLASAFRLGTHQSEPSGGKEAKGATIRATPL